MNREFAQYFQVAKDREKNAVAELEQEAIDLLADVDSESRFEKNEFYAAGGLKYISAIYDEFTQRKFARASLKSDNPPPRQILDFLKEARITARLQHQNIVPVHKVGTDEKGLPFFTMKLIEGDTLQELLDKKRLGKKGAYERTTLLEIFAKICDTISYAHSNGVLHLDLKPDNIVVGDYGEVMVCDWGLALEKDEEGRWVNDSIFSLQGTPGFIAPERLQNAAFLDERVDVYSLGVILYNMLTLRAPFIGGSADAVLKKSLMADYVLPSQLVDDVPFPLEAVIVKALAVDKNSRYNTATELAGEVRAWMSGFATEAEQANFLTQFRLLIKRNLRISVTLFSAFLIISVLIAVFIVQLAEREQRALAARDRAETEKNLRLQLRKRAATHFYQSATRQENLHNFEKAAYFCEMVVDFVPENHEAQFMMGRLYLAQGKYTQAIEAFTVVGGSDADRYKKISEKLNEGQEDDIYMGVIRELSETTFGRRVIAAICFYQPKLIRELGVSAVLSLIEPSIKQDQLLYNKKKEHMALHAPKFDFLPLISTLPLRSLDLSNTSLKFLHSIQKMPLEELNISGTQVMSLKPLEGMKIKKLNISETNVNYLEPLRNMEIQELEMSGLNVIYGTHLLHLEKLKVLTVSKDSISNKVVGRLKEKGVKVIIRP